MPRLPQVSSKDLIKVLQKINFHQVSQKGSHIKFERIKNNHRQTIIVPNHRIIKKGTLRNGILKNIPLTVDEFIILLKK